MLQSILLNLLMLQFPFQKPFFYTNFPGVQFYARFHTCPLCSKVSFLDFKLSLCLLVRARVMVRVRIGDRNRVKMRVRISKRLWLRIMVGISVRIRIMLFVGVCVWYQFDLFDWNWFKMNTSSNQKIKLVPLTNVNERHNPSRNKLR